MILRFYDIFLVTEGSLEWLSQVETLQIPASNQKYPTQLGYICTMVPGHFLILVPAPCTWSLQPSLGLISCGATWPYYPTTTLCSSRMVPTHLGRSVHVGNTHHCHAAGGREEASSLLSLLLLRSAQTEQVFTSANPKRSRALQWVLRAHLLWETGTEVQ